MNKRDKIAMIALNGILSNPGGPIQVNGLTGWGYVNCDADFIAQEAYRIADAMINAGKTNVQDS